MLTTGAAFRRRNEQGGHSDRVAALFVARRAAGGVPGLAAWRSQNRGGRDRAPAPTHQAARQPGAARRRRRVARPVAETKHAPPRSGRHPRVRRQPRRDGAGRVGLSRRGHRPDGGEFFRWRRRDQPACSDGWANLHVVPLALEQPTADFTQALAMNEDAFLAAVGTGYEAVSSDADLVCLGEMGIGNTTAAAALAAAHRRIPVLLDGFVCVAAVAPLAKLRTDALDHALAAHVSAEAAHRMLGGELRLAPLLDLGMRLGEGSGAAVGVSVLRAALACHAGMATFSEAGVANRPR